MEKLPFGFRTLQQLKDDFASGKEALKEDEYLGEDSLPYCKACKTLRVYIAKEEDWCMHGSCKCQEEARKKAEEEEKRKEFMKRFRNNKLRSLLGERYLECMFSNSTITKSNREAYEKAQNYVKNSKKVYEQNIGIYLYGDNSSGKTHLTACICNELVYKGWKCIYTNLAAILNEIRNSYDGNGMGECNLLNKLSTYDFAFIDDLGKEFIGREYNAATAKWAEQKLFEVVNSRYNAERPTIFSSNYSIGELATVLNLDKAIVERINEMATRVIKLEGDDFRSEERDTKSSLAKKFGI